MLEEPDLQEAEIAACVQDHYGLAFRQVDFLPLGADPNTAVYRLVTVDGVACFVKLRGNAFDELSVALPKFLNAQGMRQVIPPLAPCRQRLYAPLGDFTLILYPFVEGGNGYEVILTERDWGVLGEALKQLQIIQDIVVYCEQLLFSEAGGADRAQSLRYVMSNFAPDGTIEMAHRAEQEVVRSRRF